MALKNKNGKIAFLRINDVGTGFGGQDYEVIFKVDQGDQNLAYGFQLRNDANSLTHQAMFHLLKDAFNHKYVISFDFDEVINTSTYNVIRVWLERRLNLDGNNINNNNDIK